MFETAMLVALGIIIMFMRLNWKWKIRCVSNPLTCDVIILGIMYISHGGTLTGGIVGSIAALFCSVFLSIMAVMFGRIEARRYIPGIFDMSERI